MKFVDIGFGNLAAAERILSVTSPDAAPIKRMVAEAKEEGRAIDASCGQRTRAVILTDGGYLLLSALEPSELALRLNAPAE